MPILIPAPPYPRTVAIFIGSTAAEIFEWGRSQNFKWDDDFESDVKTGVKEDLGFVQLFGEQKNRHILLWMGEYSDGLFVHELLHAVDTIAHLADDRYMLFDEDGQSEARAYLFEYLFVEAKKLLSPLA